jgi:pristinamycin I synthase 3 and 4
MMAGAERHLTPPRWNANATRHHDHASVQELFEAQVRRTPGAVAVRFGADQVTYRELNQSANRLAHHLRALGVRPETVVGICSERSPATVAAMLAVLKAGGAYVALDLADPPARRGWVLEDADANVVIAQERFAAGLAARRPKVRVVLLDRLPEAARTQPNSDPTATTHPDNRAYVTYTSGSTGRPKGVETTHRGAVNHLRHLTGSGHLRPGDVALQLAPLSFDASVRDVIGPLVAGACTVLVRDDQLRYARALLEVISREQVTCIPSAVPSLLRMLCEEAIGGDAPAARLERILVSGEVLEPTTIRWARDRFGKAVQIVNQYGPTECTMTSTCQDVDGPSEDARVPIGVPIGGVRVWVLDGELQLVPVGVPGQVYIGGAGVARGYLGRPGLTAERFVPDPFAVDGQPGRLYRTGDLARWRADGSLEFLGRIDHQLKIRGFRIEPAEVEAALTAHPAVRQAVVTARADAAGGDQLVAYLVGAERVAVAALRSRLEQRLPAWMVPSVFVWLEALPLTPSGKLDRRALPAPPPARPELAEGFVAPRTPTEQALAGIWCEVLGLERVGVHDDFFDLGGHSLLAVQVLVRMRRVFRIDLPVQLLFASRTIERLASVVEEAVLDDILGTGSRPGQAAALDQHGQT